VLGVGTLTRTARSVGAAVLLLEAGAVSIVGVVMLAVAGILDRSVGPCPRFNVDELCGASPARVAFAMVVAVALFGAAVVLATTAWHLRRRSQIAWAVGLSAQIIAVLLTVNRINPTGYAASPLAIFYLFAAVAAGSVLLLGREAFPPKQRADSSQDANDVASR
jgi:hypothetical protein